MPKSRSKDFIKGELRRIVKSELATIRQKLDALIMLALIDGIYRPPKPPKLPILPVAPAVGTNDDDEGDELLKRFNERHYNGGTNAGS